MPICRTGQAGWKLSQGFCVAIWRSNSFWGRICPRPHLSSSILLRVFGIAWVVDTSPWSLSPCLYSSLPMCKGGPTSSFFIKRPLSRMQPSCSGMTSPWLITFAMILLPSKVLRHSGFKFQDINWEGSCQLVTQSDLWIWRTIKKWV